jgi:hypothetical protein
LKRPGVAGALWLISAAFAIALTLIFRTDPIQWVVTVVVGLVAAVLGLLLIGRPRAVPASAANVVAAVWIVLYAVLAVQQAGELAAWTTDAFVIALGAAAGLVAYRTAAKSIA